MMGDERIVLEILYSAGSTETISQLTMYNVFDSRRATPSPTYTAFTQFHIRARAATEPSTCNFLRRFVFILSFFPRSQCIISINWIALTRSTSTPFSIYILFYLPCLYMNMDNCMAASGAYGTPNEWFIHGPVRSRNVWLSGATQEVSNELDELNRPDEMGEGSGHCQLFWRATLIDVEAGWNTAYKWIFSLKWSYLGIGAQL